MNPFFCDVPTAVSFSGGRTSALMLRLVLDAHGGKLPEHVVVTFANTGKERPETLDFVEECSQRWGVRIRWVEYHQTQGEDGRLAHGWCEVDHESASRNGEPFAALIRARRFLPNPVMRFCTSELKIVPMEKFVSSLGWEDWNTLVGLRADEPRRVAKTTAQYGKRCPLFDAGITVHDVRSFWARQLFDLRLEPHEGNCDLCFLKGSAQISRIMRTRPDLVGWWAEREREVSGTFRKDRAPYRLQLARVRRSPLLPGFDENDDARPCACTD